jgi:2TM domain
MYRPERRQRDREYQDTDEVVGAREAARRRVRARRDFTSNIITYVVVIAVLVVIWALSGAGYFWPAWIIALWSVILLLHWWNSFGRRPITDADIYAETRRHQR